MYNSTESWGLYNCHYSDHIAALKMSNVIGFNTKRMLITINT